MSFGATRGELTSALDWLVEAGVDTLVGDTVHAWLAPAGPRQASTDDARPRNDRGAAPQLASAGAPPAALAIGVDSLPALIAAITDFKPGALVDAGVAASGVMLMGDVPSPEDFGAGALFTGDIGRLLDGMLASIGRDRAAAYLTNAGYWPDGTDSDRIPRAAGAAGAAACDPCAGRGRDRGAVRTGGRYQPAARPVADRANRWQRRRGAADVPPELPAPPSRAQGAGVGGPACVPPGDRRMIGVLLAGALLAVPAAPAEPDPSTITVTGVRGDGITAAQRRVPTQLGAAQRAGYRQVFLDIDAGRIGAAEAGLAALGDGPLHGTAQAQIWLARGSGRVPPDALAAWLETHLDLPQAPVLAGRLGAQQAAFAFPASRTLRTVTYKPAMAPRSSAAQSAADVELGTALRPLLAADRNAEAEAVWLRLRTGCTADVAAEWAERTAWSYYGAGDDASAVRMGRAAAQGSGEWAALGRWVAGLAGFRANDFAAAAADFDAVGNAYAGDDLRAAAAFWSSRAWLAAGRPDLVTPRLEAAAARRTTFYGLLAARTLGLASTLDWVEPDFITADWNTLAKIAGAHRAAALVEIGQLGLADRELKYLAATTDSTAYEPLLRLAAKLNLPATQYWLAQHPPLGADAPLSARYPAPEWAPVRGWRVDRALVFAHALQESNFITRATSRTGARGIMQIMPGTAAIVKKQLGDTGGPPLEPGDPSFNIELGQSYLEYLRDTPWTAGLLPKVVAAYNAGPGSVQKWNATLRDNADPLLFIESIPFRETRHYVEVVLRNYWMYQLRDGKRPPSIDALARNLWPKFPGMVGQDGVRIAPTYIAPALPASVAMPDRQPLGTTGPAPTVSSN